MARGGLVALVFLALACGDTDVVKDPFGGSAGIGGTAGEGGAGGELEDGQCWADEDCGIINVWCVPVEYEGFPELAEDERGICEATIDNDAVALFPKVSLVDATGEVLMGGYVVHWNLTTSSDEPLSPLHSFPGVEFPAEGSVGTIHGGWTFQFGMRFYLEVRLPEVTVSCDMLMDADGMVSGGEIIEGDELIGTLRCPGDGAHFLVSYEISEFE